MANALLELFPISTKDIYATVRPYLGQRKEFIEPSDTTKADYNSLITAIWEYEQNPSKTNLKEVKNLLTVLDLKGIRIQEDPNILLLYPDDPVKVGVTLLWRMGAVQVPGDPATYNEPLLPLALSNEHAGKDNTLFIAHRLLLGTDAKFMLAPAIHPMASKKASDCQPKRAESDPAHSLQTLYFPVMAHILKRVFPYFTVLNIHSMKDHERMKLLLVNNYNNQYLTNGNSSFPLMCAMSIASMPDEIETTPLKKTISIASMLPGFTVSDGIKKPLSSPNKPDDTMFANVQNPHTSNVIGHLADGGACNRGKQQLDKSMHIEFSPLYCSKKLSLRTQAIIQAIKLGTQMYVRYNIEKHNPWTLQEQYPKIYNDVRKYPRLFNLPETDLSLNSRTLLFSTANILNQRAVLEEEEDINNDQVDIENDEHATLLAEEETDDPVPTETKSKKPSFSM